MQRRHKDLHGGRREIAASITRLVRSETRDLVGRPCVPTPVVPLNNTTQQPRVHLCMRAVPVQIALRIIRETPDFRFNSYTVASHRRKRLKLPGHSGHFHISVRTSRRVAAALEEGRDCKILLLTNNIWRFVDLTHTHTHTYTLHVITKPTNCALALISVIAKS